MKNDENILIDCEVGVLRVRAWNLTDGPVWTLTTIMPEHVVDGIRHPAKSCSIVIRPEQAKQVIEALTAGSGPAQETGQ